MPGVRVVGDSRTHGGASLEEVATALGVSKQRVGQIQQEALKKLRLICICRGLTLADFLPDAVPASYWDDMED